MKVFYFEKEQLIARSIDEVWSFFSTPKNLKELTPAYLDFKIHSKLPERGMYPGQMISYTVHPILGIPLNWLTEITQVREKHFFVDEQRKGPYALWHHEHHFKEISDGVLMTDKLHYALPSYLGGRISNYLFVRKQLETIFKYRFDKIEEIFSAKAKTN